MGKMGKRKYGKKEERTIRAELGQPAMAPENAEVNPDTMIADAQPAMNYEGEPTMAPDGEGGPESMGPDTES
jgi:hypothetical protein